MGWEWEGVAVKSIWKYELSVTDAQLVSMPADASILCVQMQRGKPCLWVLVEETARREKRAFCIFGTGNHFTAGPHAEYIGTFQDGPLVWHLFEVAVAS